VGRRVAERLLAAGHPVRVVTRTPEKLTPLGARGGDVKTGPVTDESPRSYVSELVRTSGTSTPKASTTDE
jgi:uncharacterized protein YbjT (DUF2867 family)